MSTHADRLARLVATAIGPLPLRLRAWDGSEAGPDTTTSIGSVAGSVSVSVSVSGSGSESGQEPVLVVNSPNALRRLIRDRNELGLAQAYIAGDLDIAGNVMTALTRLWRPESHVRKRIPLHRWPVLAVGAIRLGAFGKRPPPPGQTAVLAGQRHSRDRDRAAIAHHYDVGNEFYQLILDDSMAYSCGYFAEGPEMTPAQAQTAKLDLICRKLGLEDGNTHLDIGCGWGALACHAAEHFGTHSTAVTLSKQQYEYIADRVAKAGLADRVTVIHADYRELTDGRFGRDFDAISTIEMGEHVGEAEYPAFCSLLHDLVRPGGRVLVQQMSRGNNAPGGGTFIQTYIAPDMHMKPLGRTTIQLATAGLEIRDVHALREHYVWTIEGWLQNLEDNWTAAVELIGETGARTWRLYLAGSAVAFASGRMGVDQILGVRPHPDGRSDLPAGRAGWER